MRPPPQGAGAQRRSIPRHADLSEDQRFAHQPVFPMASPELRYAQLPGARLRYVEQGAGPAVVFVHGAMGDHRVWEGQREAVAERYRYVALDQRHFGTADWPPGEPSYSVATHASDLAAFIAFIGAGEPVHLVGWSYGGAVALALAARHPAALRSLFLCEPALLSIVDDAADLTRLRAERASLRPAIDAGLSGNLLEATRRFAEWVDDDPGSFERMPAAARAIFVDNARTVPLHFAAPAAEAVTCADLARLDLPAEVTLGELTRPFFRILAETTARCIPGARLSVIEGARHLAPLESAPAFNRTLLQFLSRQQVAPPAAG